MTRYLLGDLVRNCKEKVDRDNNPYEYFVAGDHMETERPRLTMRGRFDEADVGPAFIRLFRPGQVLYGSRRTYLKKVSVADFEGVTSNVTFVLETKDDSILPQRLLPFLLLSDRFTSYSIGKSKGSTNPYVLFSDLADFEIDLPEPKTVAEIADIMCAAERLKEDYRSLIATCDDVVKSQFVEMFGGPDPTESDCPPVTIGELAADMRYGTSKKASDSGEFKYLRMNNMTDDGRLDLSDLKYIDLSGAELENAKVVRGDLLFNRTNSREKVGKTCVFNKNEPMVIAGYIVRVRFDERVEPGYVSAFLNSSYGKGLLRKMAKGAVGQANISAKEMAKIELPLPPIELQRSFLDFVAQVDKSKFAVQKALDELNATTKKILDQELGLGDV